MKGKYKCAYCYKRYKRIYSNWTLKHFAKYHPEERRKLINMEDR